ncbi:TPA: tyrosine-type recombinase/integrase [Enterobacter asburiae]|uniref:phage integrase n=1 Tax=Enterobacter asburiae TaxID=61645 RepID=UPI001A1A22B9|nr:MULTISPECIES: tyrosine-type recombinase/integrase [Enterobacteriaceae]MCG3819435.1 tyrosine-type recombinase/integrase [Escherichia coli]MCU3443461.1 tyrosine-type recombinase/integrase [Enterobacter asburiae]HAT7488017.1 tyrosine-type recombinase/integrase [Enterobacter asburiae]HAT7510445.1 tyrosine-type recombinase/integrase [Enterobacter asburiae]HDR2866356.1 tyrosine-type recombinase/integrase [Enterobacter asburiae]
MSIKKLEGGQYEVDVWPRGRNGKRIRRRFEKKQEAVLFERYVLANADKKEWLGASVDRRTLSELLDTWWLLYGQTQENGEIEKRHLNKTIRALGDPAVNRLNKRMIAQHRSQRLENGISAATINRDIYRLSGMFSTLIKLEEFRKENPCKGLEPLKEAPPTMTYLAKSEISKLLDTLTGDDRRVALLCLSTGARWGEGSTLRGEQVNHGRVTFLKTKNGKKRTVPISEELEKEIKTSDTGPLFKVDYENFCERLRLVKPDLPRGQATHVLRHTFASWFMMNGGNIIALQQILGHASIQQTMVYAHLAPDYLQHAVTLNPLGGGLMV